MKNVIKALGIIAIAAVIGFSFTACGSDGDNSGSGGGNTRSYEDFAGTWVDSSYGGSYTFNGNTYVFTEGPSFRVTGTFTFTSTHITQTPNDPTTPSQYQGVFTYTLSGNQLTLSKADGYLSGNFTKQ